MHQRAGVFVNAAGAQDSRTSALAFAALFFALALGACLLREPARMALLVDNQHYFFIAERAASGVPPHVSHFDPKNALSLLITAAAIKLSRAMGLGDDLAAARWISMLWGSASVALVWLCTWVLTRRRRAAHLSAVVMLGFSLFFIMTVMGARPKVFLVPFLVLPVMATQARRPLWAGVFSGAAFLCWQPALMVAAGALVALALEPRRLPRGATLLAAGVLLPVLAYEAYFLAHGALGPQLEQSLVFPRDYLTHRGSLAVWKVHAGWLFHLRNGIELASLAPLGFLLALLSVAGWSVRRRRGVLEKAREHPGAVHLLVVSVAALAFTVHDYQGFPDEFLLAPYVAILWGTLLAAAASAAARGRPAPVRVLAAATAWALAAAPAVEGTTRNYVPAGLAEQRAAGRAVGGFLAGGHSVYAVGCTHLLAFNHHDNFVPYGFFFRGMEAYLATRANSPEGYRPLDANGRMPDVILVSRGFVPGGEDWLRSEYRERTPALFARQRIKVWKRIDPARRWGEAPAVAPRTLSRGSPGSATPRVSPDR